MCAGLADCASHQEMREAVVRGLDGPGISPLDVHPSSWAHVEGFQAEMEHRQRRLAELQVCLCVPPHWAVLYCRQTKCRRVHAASW